MHAIIARYPQARSALLPMLHLVQSEEGYVTPDGIALCAEVLGLTTAEVAAVATFYTMYKRRPVGDYHVGVCTNTLCAVLGGDAIFAALKDHLGVGNDETTADGKVTLEHIECNAACDYAPGRDGQLGVLRQPDARRRANELVDALRAGDPPTPDPRRAACARSRRSSRVLAGFPDGRVGRRPLGRPGLAGRPRAGRRARRVRTRGHGRHRPGS